MGVSPFSLYSEMIILITAFYINFDLMQTNIKSSDNLAVHTIITHYELKNRPSFSCCENDSLFRGEKYEM